MSVGLGTGLTKATSNLALVFVRASGVAVDVGRHKAMREAIATATGDATNAGTSNNRACECSSAHDRKCCQRVNL